MKKISILCLVLMLIINIGGVICAKQYAVSYKKEYEKQQSTAERKDLIEDFQKKAELGANEFALALPILKAGEEARKGLLPFIASVAISVVCSMLSLLPIGMIKIVDQYMGVHTSSEDERAIKICSIIFLIINVLIVTFAINDAMGMKSYLDAITNALSS